MFITSCSSVSNTSSSNDLKFSWATNPQSKSSLRTTATTFKKLPPRGVPRKRYSENTQQIYRRAKLLCNFIEIALRHGCSPVNLLHIFRIPFLKNTSRWLLVHFMRMKEPCLKLVQIFNSLMDRVMLSVKGLKSFGLVGINHTTKNEVFL